MSDQQCLCETAEHCPVHYCGEHAEELPCFVCGFNANQHLLANAHRTAIDLVLANISTAIADWGGHAEAVLVLKGIRASITAMRDWTPEHAAEALRETKNK